VRVLTYAYRKVGVHPRYAFAVMLLSLFGSGVDIPMFAIVSGSPARAFQSDRGRAERRRRADPDPGLVVPPGSHGMYVRMLIGTAIVAAVVHSLAQAGPGRRNRGADASCPGRRGGRGLAARLRRAPPVAYVAARWGP